MYYCYKIKHFHSRCLLILLFVINIAYNLAIYDKKKCPLMKAKINQTTAIFKFLTLENLPDSKVSQGQCLTHNVGHRLQGLV